MPKLYVFYNIEGKKNPALRAGFNIIIQLAG
jgi:hypothetical protein